MDGAEGNAIGSGGKDGIVIDRDIIGVVVVKVSIIIEIDLLPIAIAAAASRTDDLPCLPPPPRLFLPAGLIAIYSPALHLPISLLGDILALATAKYDQTIVVTVIEASPDDEFHLRHLQKGLMLLVLEAHASVAFVIIFVVVVLVISIF